MRQEQLFTVPEVAEHLRVSVKTVRRMVQDGSLPHRRVGNQLRFSGADFEMLIERPSTSADRASVPVAELAPLTVPEWARTRVANWRAGLQRLMPSHGKLHVVVMDRRGAKTFRILAVDGFSWGKNLWHSNAVESLPDSHLRKQFAHAHVVIFDEMIQHGRKIALLRRRLESLDISVHTLCLIRRRSYFLDGKIHDPQVQAVEDLDDEGFARTATFLSRLLARQSPPMDVEHIVVVGTASRNPTTPESIAALSEFAETEVVWLSEPGNAGAVDAITFDRPFFFDPSRVQLPEGISAVWDGPLKIRGYYDHLIKQLVLVFIAFPRLEGSSTAWSRLIDRTSLRFGGKSTDIELLSSDALTDQDLEHAYADVCTDASLELLRQSVTAGLFMCLGVAEANGLPATLMASIFGNKRGKRLTKDIRSSLRPMPANDLFKRQQESIPVCIDPARAVVRNTRTSDARKAVLDRIQRRWRSGHDEPERAPMSFPQLIRSTAPIDERAISAALDHELDVGTVQPTQRVERFDDDLLRVERAYWRGEYEGEYLSTYDEESTRRSRVVAANALALWLQHSDREAEAEFTVAKLLANLVHDWEDALPPLDFSWKPYKHGAVPSSTPDNEYLIPILAEESWLEDRTKSGYHRRRFAPGASPWRDLFRAPLCPGSVTAHVRGLVRAYWAIQSECRHATSDNLARPVNPLVVLASARNEKTAYRCARYELVYWIATGYKGFFPALMDVVALDCSNHERLEMLRRSVAELAQAARFLDAKLDMYRRLPDLRRQMTDLFGRTALDFGDVILDTVDRSPRFSHSFGESNSPLGLLEEAAAIIRPFTSLLRQVLTVTGVEVDKRLPKDRQVVLADGSTANKDIAYYLRALLDAAPEIARSIGPTLDLAIAQAQTSCRLDVAIAQRLHSTFGEIVNLLKSRIYDLQRDPLLEERRRKLELDLVRVPKRLAGRFKSGYVAVGDFYSFISFVTSAPDALVAGDLQTRAERVQAWMFDVGERTVRKHTSSSLVGLHGDTIVIAGPDATDVVLSAMTFCRELRVENVHWDRHVGAMAADFVRFGIAKFDDTGDGPTSPLSAVLEAHRIADRHGQPRGTVGISQLVRAVLPEAVCNYFNDESSIKDERQGTVSSWRLGSEVLPTQGSTSVAS